VQTGSPWLSQSQDSFERDAKGGSWRVPKWCWVIQYGHPRLTPPCLLQRLWKAARMWHHSSRWMKISVPSDQYSGEVRSWCHWVHSVDLGRLQESIVYSQVTPGTLLRKSTVQSRQQRQGLPDQLWLHILQRCVWAIKYLIAYKKTRELDRFTLSTQFRIICNCGQCMKSWNRSVHPYSSKHHICC